MTSFVLPALAGLGVAVSGMLLLWLASLARRDASIVDAFWGPGFAALAWVYAISSDGVQPRRGWALALVTTWGLRLGLHLWRRNRGRGEDYRYRAMREQHGERFPLVSLFTVFLLQGALMWLISAPLLQAVATPAAPGWGWLDSVALASFLLGFAFEALGDRQLRRFRSDPRNRGRVLRSGLWRYTRHPNYFGDAVVWWSFFLLALGTGGAWWTIYSPLLMTFLLLKVSGVGLLEKRLRETRPQYADYVAGTSAFVPWFPRGAK